MAARRHRAIGPVPSTSSIEASLWHPLSALIALAVTVDTGPRFFADPLTSELGRGCRGAEGVHVGVGPRGQSIGRLAVGSNSNVSLGAATEYRRICTTFESIKGHSSSASLALLGRPYLIRACFIARRAYAECQLPNSADGMRRGVPMRSVVRECRAPFSAFADRLLAPTTEDANASYAVGYAVT